MPRTIKPVHPAFNVFKKAKNPKGLAINHAHHEHATWFFPVRTNQDYADPFQWSQYFTKKKDIGILP